MLLGGLGAVGARLTAWGHPTAAASRLYWLLLSSSAFWQRLGAAVQEDGERVGGKPHLGG